MEHINTIVIDEEMKTALLEWIRQFSDEGIQWSNLVDGVLLNNVMKKINPDHVLQRRRESTSDDGARLIQMWTSLVDAILNFYQDSLQYLVFIKPPDAQLIYNDPCSDGALKEIEVVVLMMLGCAVQCSHKKLFVEQIRSLGASHHPAIVKCIKEITDQPEHFVHISQINSEKFQMISKNLRIATHARQDLMMRVVELTTEVNGLKELQKKEIDKGTGDNGNNDKKLSESYNADEAINFKEDQSLKIKELQELLDEKTGHLFDVTNDLEKSRMTINLLEQENLVLAQQARTYRDELEIANEKTSKLSHLEKKLSKLQKKLEDLDFWKQHASYLTEENDKLCQLKGQLENDVQFLKKKCEDLKFYETEVNRCEKELKEMAEARELDRELIRELSSGKAKLENENYNLLSAFGNNFTGKTYGLSECQNTALFKRSEKLQTSNKKDAENVDETAKLDESFATLYDLDLPHDSQRSVNQIETARLVDIDGSQLEAYTQTEHVDQKYDSDDYDNDLQNRLNRRRSWMISSEERKINATVESLSKEIKKLKDFVKLKDASILLMKLKVDEKTKECAQMATEIEECTKKHQLEIEQLKTQNLSDTSGKDAMKSENESMKSRLTTAQVKIENLKREREKIQQELSNFNERVTQLIIENNRLLAQHEAAVRVCGKVEDENMKLLDQLRDTLNQNQELLIMILMSRDHRAEEQKSYIEQLSELKHSKEKLESKILEQLRKKEKRLGIGTLVRKIKNKNKPTKSEQFLMSLESPSRSSETPSDQLLDDSDFRRYLEERKNLFNQKSKDFLPSAAYISTPSLVLPRKPPRTKDSEPSFSNTLQTNLAHNKRLFQSEMNVSSFVDIKSCNDETALEKDTSGTAGDEESQKNSDTEKESVVNIKKVTGPVEIVGVGSDNTSCKNEQSPLKNCEILKVTSNILKKDEDSQIDNSHSLNSEIHQQTSDCESIVTKSKKNHVSINVFKSGHNLDNSCKDSKGIPPPIEEEKIDSDIPSLGRFKTSEDLRHEGVALHSLPDQSKAEEIKTLESEKCESKFQLEKLSSTHDSEHGILKDLRCTSISGTSELFLAEENQLGQGYSRRPHPEKQLRAFSDWNIQPLKIKPGTKFPTFRASVQSAFSSAGKKIVKEMSHFRDKVSSKDFSKAKPWKDSPRFNEQVKSQTLTAEFGTESGQSMERKWSRNSEDNCWKSQFDEDKPNTSKVNQATAKLTFDNLAERRPAKIEVDAQVICEPKIEVPAKGNKNQIDELALAEPQRKKQAPIPQEQCPVEEKRQLTPSRNSSTSLSEEFGSPPTFLSESRRSLTSSSSSSSSPELPYRESNVCI